MNSGAIRDDDNAARRPSSGRAVGWRFTGYALTRCLVGDEEPAEHPAQRHQRGPQAQREAARRAGGGGRASDRLAALERIRAATDDVLAGGVELVGELSGVPDGLAITDSTVKQVSVGAVRYAGSVAKLLG